MRFLKQIPKQQNFVKRYPHFMQNILNLKNISFQYQNTSQMILNHANMHLVKSECCGLIGPSGSGKTTIIKMILGNLRPNTGDIFIKDHNIFNLKKRELFKIRKSIGFVMQDPYLSLHPKKTVKDNWLEFFKVTSNEINLKEWEDKINLTINHIGLSKKDLLKYPHEFSGGQRQRIAIGRSLLLSPDLLICDEPVSALDLSVQAHILNLLVELQSQYELSILFISHDKNVIKYLCHRTYELNNMKLCLITL